MYTNRNRTAEIKQHILPDLKDPSHPGMWLVSKILLLYLTAFVVLITIISYILFGIQLDFELKMQGITQVDETNGSFTVTLYSDKSLNSLINDGDKSEIRIGDNGQIIEAEVSDIIIGEGVNNDYSSIILLVNDSDKLSKDLNIQTGQPLTGIVFPQPRSMWTIISNGASFSF